MKLELTQPEVVKFIEKHVNDYEINFQLREVGGFWSWAAKKFGFEAVSVRHSDKLLLQLTFESELKYMEFIIKEM